MRELPFRLKAVLGVLAFLAVSHSVVWVIVLFAPDTTYESRVPRAVADVTHPTAYEREIADLLATDPVYVDPLMAGFAGGVIDDRVREAVAQADFPTYLVALPDFNRLGVAGSDEAMFARIVHAAGRPGLYLRLSDLGELRHIVRDEEHLSVHLQPSYDVDTAGLLRALEGAQQQLRGDEFASFIEFPPVAGFLTGAMLSVPLWLLLRLVRRSSRRDTTYLAGLQ